MKRLHSQHKKHMPSTCPALGSEAPNGRPRASAMLEERSRSQKETEAAEEATPGCSQNDRGRNRQPVQAQLPTQESPDNLICLCKISLRSMHHKSQQGFIKRKPHTMSAAPSSPVFAPTGTTSRKFKNLIRSPQMTPFSNF